MVLKVVLSHLYDGNSDGFVWTSRQWNKIKQLNSCSISSFSLLYASNFSIPLVAIFLTPTVNVVVSIVNPVRCRLCRIFTSICFQLAHSHLILFVMIWYHSREHHNQLPLHANTPHCRTSLTAQMEKVQKSIEMKNIRKCASCNRDTCNGRQWFIENCWCFCPCSTGLDNRRITDPWYFPNQ